MNAYSNYNQIHMHEADMDKTSFMAEWDTYWYNIILFVLKKNGSDVPKKNE